MWCRLQTLIAKCVHVVVLLFFFAEIYKIVSQKQLRDGPGDEHPDNHHMQTITVAPTDPSSHEKKKCCS